MCFVTCVEGTARFRCTFYALNEWINGFLATRTEEAAVALTRNWYKFTTIRIRAPVFGKQRGLIRSHLSNHVFAALQLYAHCRWTCETNSTHFCNSIRSVRLGNCKRSLWIILSPRNSHSTDSASLTRAIHVNTGFHADEVTKPRYYALFLCGSHCRQTEAFHVDASHVERTPLATERRYHQHPSPIANWTNIYLK